MRNELIVAKRPVRAVNNLVVVSVQDTFEGFRTRGGIELVNLTENDSWGDSGEYNISEFVMRYGTVEHVPEVISKGSYNYRTNVEVKRGDIVFWNLISFKDHIPIVVEKQLFLLVDYHELIARERDGEVTPLNGMGLFSPVELKQKIIAHTITAKLSDDWILEKLPDNKVVYDDHSRSDSDVWEVGDKVKLLVRQSPYKLEGTIRRRLEKELYACPIKYIICTS